MKTENKYLRGIILFIVLIAVLFGIYVWKKPQPTEGEKEIGITVIDEKGQEVQYFDTTNADYLRTVLDELKDQDFIYSGDESSYGYYVDTVNGVKADNVNEFWAFYVNGEYCSYGVDNQPVNDGDMFEIIYEKVQQNGGS